MRSRFWNFVETCDEAQSPRAVRDLLLSTFRDLDVKLFAILTHAPVEVLRSLSVVVHNWPSVAIDFLYEGDAVKSPNAMFIATEATTSPVEWPTHETRRNWRKADRLWFAQLVMLLGGGSGISQGLRSPIVGASCSIVPYAPMDEDRVRLCMRIANYAYQQILVLQRPNLAEADKLTTREHEFLYRATILGEPPRDVANQLGVKISTVRTLRQKASVRLESDSQEQAAWRMVETGQLFRSGRKGRARSR